MLGTYRAGDNRLSWLLYNADSTKGSHLSQRNLGQELFDVRKAHAIGDGLFEVLQECRLLACWNYVPDLHGQSKHQCTDDAAFLAAPLQCTSFVWMDPCLGQYISDMESVLTLAAPLRRRL